MATEPKESLHHLSDALPASELVAAEPYLAFLLRLGYPCVRTFLDTPQVADPQSKGDREAPTEGGVVSERERRAELGISHGTRSGPAPLSGTGKRLDPAMGRRAWNAVIEPTDSGCDDVAKLPGHNTARMAAGWGNAGCPSPSTALQPIQGGTPCIGPAPRQARHLLLSESPAPAARQSARSRRRPPHMTRCPQISNERAITTQCPGERRRTPTGATIFLDRTARKHSPSGTPAKRPT